MKKLNLSNIEGKLSRTEMKNIKGGSGGGNGYYRCCWNGSSNCSACVYSYAGAPCVSGAFLQAC